MTQFSAPVKRETTQKQKVGFAVLGGVGAVVLGVMVYLLAFAPLPEAEINCSPTPNVRTDAQVETSVVVAPTANFTDIELPLEIAKQRLVPALSDPTLINTLSAVVANDNPRKLRDLVIVQEPGEVIQDFEEARPRPGCCEACCELRAQSACRRCWPRNKPAQGNRCRCRHLLERCIKKDHLCSVEWLADQW